MALFSQGLLNVWWSRQERLTPASGEAFWDRCRDGGPSDGGPDHDRYDCSSPGKDDTPFKARLARGVFARPYRRAGDIASEEMLTRLREVHALSFGPGALWSYTDARPLTYKK